MLVITENQMQIFRASAIESFVKRMVSSLRQDFPNELLALRITDNTIEPLVRQAISQALNYGIEYRDDVHAYVELVPLLGPNFECDSENSWIRDILNDPALSGHEKIEAIYSQSPFGETGG